MTGRFVWILIGDFKKEDNGDVVEAVVRFVYSSDVSSLCNSPTFSIYNYDVTMFFYTGSR